MATWFSASTRRLALPLVRPFRIERAGGAWKGPFDMIFRDGARM